MAVGRAFGSLTGLLLALALVPAARAIETDQYYAWGRPLADARDVLNAKLGLEIERALDHVNQRASSKNQGCLEVHKRLVRRFRMFLFHDVELWALNTSLIERVPADAEEEFRFRRRYLYHDVGPFDTVRLIPPSPTIEVAGVRMGTDKLTHFLLEGWWYYRWYRKGREKGLSHEEAERRAIDRGILTERTVLGMAASGVLSLADLEANYAGLRFLVSLCHGDEPLLERTEQGWRLREPFDIADYVSPEWDESFQPSIFNKRRWKRVRPLLRRYCPRLDDPAVRARRERYARRDSVTPTERRVREFVARGKLRDPEQFSIERVCAEERTPGGSEDPRGEVAPGATDPGR